MESGWLFRKLNIMKKLALLILIIATQTLYSQKYFTRTGITKFKASTDTFEPVEATNKSSSAILKTNTGDIATLLLIKAFKFKVALMQEHFNENYMDSDQYPKATFQGNINHFNISEINSKKEYSIQGILTIRGVKKNIKTTGTFLKKNDTLYLNTNFNVKAQDFNIKIPGIVRKKIAETINISLNYELVKKK